MPTGEIDLERFRLPANLTARPQSKRKPPRHCRKDFLRGPIPWTWLAQAMHLPDKALAVPLILWREPGITNLLTVALSQKRLRECGILPDAARRAVRNLETAGLIEVRRHPGRKLEVIILDNPRSDRNGKP
jgi:hypothetical protein